MVARYAEERRKAARGESGIVRASLRLSKFVPDKIVEPTVGL